MSVQSAETKTVRGACPQDCPDTCAFIYHVEDGKLVEVIELAKHPFFLACQFHPEFHSKPHQPHPLFRGFIAAAHAHTHHRPL